jgi:N6-adenosine-specific RNA methylase IME4
VTTIPTIVIDKEFADLITPLRDDERGLLEQNLKQDGCRNALVLWYDEATGLFILIDGHNRYEICTRLKLRFRTKVLKFESREHVKLWILENQMGQRNLDDDQRAVLGNDIREQRSLVEKVEHGAKIKAAKAKLLKLKAGKELEKADPALFEKVVNGELSLKKAKKVLKEQIRLMSKKAKEIAAKELADGASAKSNDAKPRGIKEISRKTRKTDPAQQAEKAKQPRPRKRKAEVQAGLDKSKPKRKRKQRKAPSQAPGARKQRKDTRKAVSEEKNIPERKLTAAQRLKQADPAKYKKVRLGKMSLADATREVKRTQLVQSLASVEAIKAKEVAGTFDVFVIDPPWPMEKIERDERPNQSEFEYPTMTIDEIKAHVDKILDQHAEKNAHVFLWTTHRFLPDAFAVLDHCGVAYVCTFVWHKPGGFQPIGLPQYNCEFVLYARVGEPKFIETREFPTCFGPDEAPRTGHSEKPEFFYEMLRRVTGGRRLDMYNRRTITGFDGYGKEAAEAAVAS